MNRINDFNDLLINSTFLHMYFKKLSYYIQWLTHTNIFLTILTHLPAKNKFKNTLWNSNTKICFIV